MGNVRYSDDESLNQPEEETSDFALAKPGDVDVHREGRAHVEVGDIVPVEDSRKLGKVDMPVNEWGAGSVRGNWKVRTMEERTEKISDGGGEGGLREEGKGGLYELSCLNLLMDCDSQWVL